MIAWSPGVFIGADVSGVAQLQCCWGGTSLSAPLWAGYSRAIAKQHGAARLGMLIRPSIASRERGIDDHGGRQACVQGRRRNAAFRPLAWRAWRVHGGCMAGWRDACLIAAFAAGFAAMGGGATPAFADDQALTRQGPVRGGDEIARGTVGRILDGRTFALDDGREIRLAAIEVAPLACPQDRADPAGRAAAAALGALAAGDQVVLRRAESGSARSIEISVISGTNFSSPPFGPPIGSVLAR